ncbi:hypothetical protein MAR_007479 [Mya arenaria]|uniref:TACO1/YebC-like second and third domain-containing protein n=1 Tax=Mya arenaria TaxID=6604 RepID=A0ABY7DFZ4_MYAAR|nr:hypothetical protein MAR_007479 [Mya arenaria]
MTYCSSLHRNNSQNFQHQPTVTSVTVFCSLQEYGWCSVQVLQLKVMHRPIKARNGGPEEKGNKKMTDVIEQMKKAGVPKQNIKSMIDNIVSNMDPYLEIAIEVGAEDVIITKDENNDQIIIKFHCDPKHLPRVTSEVQETHGLNVTNTEVEFTPLRYCVLEHEEDFKAVDTIIQKVENYTGVVRVIDNITVPEE